MSSISAARPSQPTIRTYPDRYTLIPLFKCDAASLHKGRERKDGKRPLDQNWTKREYPRETVLKLAAKGHNVGVRLTAEQLVVDVDPRNGGNTGFNQLCRDLGLDPTEWPCVITGGGGQHYYLTLPPSVRVIDTLESYPGVEFKSKGRQVLAAGCIHPETGKHYEWDAAFSPSIVEGAPLAPPQLVEAILRPERTSEVTSGQFSPEQVATALDRLDPCDFDTNATWFPLMAACHHASGGEARQEWIDFSTCDAAFKDDADIIGRRWDSLFADRPDSITYKTLNKALRDAGGSNAQLVPAVGEDEFGDVPEEKVEEFAPSIVPTAFAWVDPEQIPPRQWLYKPSYIRKFIGLTAATGGAGKSSLIIVECLAMASAKALLGIEPSGPLKVWYWNGEDPREELDRRVAAAIKYYNLTASDLEGRFFYDSGRDMPIKLARTRRGDTYIAEPLVAEVIAALRDNKIDVLVIDPFVSSHDVAENDNGAIERVAKKWADIADKTGCAIMLSHHTRKTGGEAATIEDSRGASALNYAARTRRAINTMSVKEAQQAGVPEGERRSYFRADKANSSMTPPAHALDWYKLESVDLGNGDSVGVVTAWEHPANEPIDLLGDDFANLFDALSRGGPWRKDAQAKQWIGRPIAKELGLDLQVKADRTRINRLIRDWTESGLLEEYEDLNERRQIKEFLRAKI